MGRERSTPSSSLVSIAVWMLLIMSQSFRVCSGVAVMAVRLLGPAWSSAVRNTPGRRRVPRLSGRAGPRIAAARRKRDDPVPRAVIIDCDPRHGRRRRAVAGARLAVARHPPGHGRRRQMPGSPLPCPTRAPIVGLAGRARPGGGGRAPPAARRLHAGAARAWRGRARRRGAARGGRPPRPASPPTRSARCCARPHPPPSTLVGIGPATNIALALATEPAIAARVQEIVLMSGAAGEGKHHRPRPEFNAWSDPEALAVVLGLRPPGHARDAGADRAGVLHPGLARRPARGRARVSKRPAP